MLFSDNRNLVLCGHLPLIIRTVCPFLSLPSIVMGNILHVIGRSFLGIRHPLSPSAGQDLPPPSAKFIVPTSYLVVSYLKYGLTRKYSGIDNLNSSFLQQCPLHFLQITLLITTPKNGSVDPHSNHPDGVFDTFNRFSFSHNFSPINNYYYYYTQGTSNRSRAQYPASQSEPFASFSNADHMSKMTQIMSNLTQIMSKMTF